MQKCFYVFVVFENCNRNIENINLWAEGTGHKEPMIIDIKFNTSRNLS